MKALVKLLICLALSFPLMAWAIRLGEIELRSSLNNPLKAQILVKEPEQFKTEDFQVALASDRAFSQLEMDKPTYLDRLQFTVSPAPEGFLIEVTTKEPLGQPVVDFLLDFRWPDGRLLRRYTLLLDLPVEHRTNSIDKPAATPGVVDAAPVPVRRHVHAQVYHHKDVYGPTTSRDQLIYVARELRPDPSVSIAQTALAVYHANPDAFIDHNINQLKQGVVLHAPTLTEVQAIDPQDAEQQVWSKKGHVLPKEYRNHAGSVIVNAGEDIFTVAQRVRPSEAVSVEQTAWALFQLNRRGFAYDNIHGLRAGQVLRVPSAPRVKQTSDVEALHALDHQSKLWKEIHVAEPGTAKAPEQVSASAPAAEVMEQPAAADQQARLVAVEQLANDADDSVAKTVKASPEQAAQQGGPAAPEAALSETAQHASEQLTEQAPEQEAVSAQDSVQQESVPAASEEAPTVVVKEETPVVAEPVVEPTTQPTAAVEDGEAVEASQQPNQEEAAAMTQPQQSAVDVEDMADSKVVEHGASSFDWYAILTLILAICATVGGLFWWRQRRLDMQYANIDPAPGVLRRYLDNVNTLARNKFKLNNKQRKAEIDEAAILADALALAATVSDDDMTAIKAKPLTTTTVAASAEVTDRAVVSETVAQETIAPGPEVDIVTPAADQSQLVEPEMGTEETPAIDALEEAVVYMAYQRYAQAEACLQRALDRSPTREELKLGLLEVYARTREADKFADIESMLSPNLRTQKPNLWDKLQALKAELTDGGQSQAAAQEPTSHMEYVADSERRVPRSRQSKSAVAKKGAAVKEDEVVTAVDHVDATVEQAQPVEFAPLEFDLTTESSDSRESSDVAAVTANTTVAINELAEDSSSDLPGLAFEISAQADDESALSLEPMTVNDDEENSQDALLGNAVMDLNAELELAEAYVEIGDAEGARELLEDVVKRSSGNLQARAQELIKKINKQ